MPHILLQSINIKYFVNMYNLSFEDLPKAVGQLYQKIDSIQKLLLERDKQQSQKQSNIFLTVQQAAEFLNLSKATIYSKCSRSELPHMKRGKRLYFSQTELDKYLKSGRVKTISEIQNEADQFLSSKK